MQRESEQIRRSLPELEEKLRTLQKPLAPGVECDKQTEKDIVKTLEKIHYTFFPLLLRAREVKMAFFEMVRGILQAYIKEELLTDFKGANTRSGHMPNYLFWQMSMDIFHLINREAFKKVKDAGAAASRQTFFVKLVYYPSLQNFLCDKFFPQS